MPSSPRRRAKIVCTLGPSSRTQPRLAALAREGMDVARLNFSHGTHAQHRAAIELVREVARETGTPLAILQDLQGPKLRVGKLGDEGLKLAAGDRLLLHPEGSRPSRPAGFHCLPISAEIAEPIARDVSPGARILFDDGRIAARVLSASAPEIRVEIEVGGLLTDHKGMNLPGTPLSIPCLTAKDQKDLDLGLACGVDAIAVSFVRTASEIEEIRARIERASNHRPLVVSKMERAESIENHESLIDVSDALLIARGDMAVEIGAERVPAVQKKLVRACNSAGKPVVTATQMLESMIHSPTPTRAEASDVANAVYDGTDAVMLSAETASGEYPVEAVRVMCRVILEAERTRESYSTHADCRPQAGSTIDAIEHAASEVAHLVGASAIACLTHSGTAARALARFRPYPPIVAIVSNELAQRQLQLVWGVSSRLVSRKLATDALFQEVEKELVAGGFVEPGDYVVVTAGIPTLARGTTNTLRVHRVG